MTRKLRFAAIFLVTFGVLIAVWWATNFPHRYRDTVLASVQLVSPVVNGWWLDYDRPNMIDRILFRRGDAELPMLLQLPALSMGLMPLISLLMATPGLKIKRRAVTIVVGCVLYFLLDVAVVLAYPVIMSRPNAFKDTMGVFTGLLAFALAPMGLWFVLTYPVLRSVWRLSPTPGHKPGK